MRWGFPPPPNLGTRPVTNVRNLASPYWRGWLKRECRCLVPATAFCEYTDSTPKLPHWFALEPTRPLFAFAGIWRPLAGTRGTSGTDGRTPTVRLPHHRGQRAGAAGPCQGHAGDPDRGHLGFLAGGRHCRRARVATAVPAGADGDSRHRPAPGRGGVAQHTIASAAGSPKPVARAASKGVRGRRDTASPLGGVAVGLSRAAGGRTGTRARSSSGAKPRLHWSSAFSSPAEPGRFPEQTAGSPAVLWRRTHAALSISVMNGFAGGICGWAPDGGCGANDSLCATNRHANAAGAHGGFRRRLAAEAGGCGGSAAAGVCGKPRRARVSGGEPRCGGRGGEFAYPDPHPRGEREQQVSPLQPGQDGSGSSATTVSGNSSDGEQDHRECGDAEQHGADAPPLFRFAGAGDALAQFLGHRGLAGVDCLSARLRCRRVACGLLCVMGRCPDRRGTVFPGPKVSRHQPDAGFSRSDDRYADMSDPVSRCVDTRCSQRWTPLGSVSALRPLVPRSVGAAVFACRSIECHSLLF